MSEGQCGLGYYYDGLVEECKQCYLRCNSPPRVCTTYCTQCKYNTVLTFLTFDHLSSEIIMQLYMNKHDYICYCYGICLSIVINIAIWIVMWDIVLLVLILKWRRHRQMKLAQWICRISMSIMDICFSVNLSSIREQSPWAVQHSSDPGLAVCVPVCFYYSPAAAAGTEEEDMQTFPKEQM